MGDTIGERLREAREQYARRQGQRIYQRPIAERLGVNEATYRSYEYDKATIPEQLAKMLAALYGRSWRWFYEGDVEVGAPSVPVAQLAVPIPYIGAINASEPVDWSDPFESEEMEEVPPEMAGRGRFSCRVKGDSMYEFLWPGDLCVFQAESFPKIGYVILHRMGDRKATIKQLKHSGTEFVLHPLNPSYQDVPANGDCVGYLVGIVRDLHSKRMTLYDPHGITP